MSTVEDLKDQIRKHSDTSKFADRLMEITHQIDREFEGLEREQLLGVVHETLERHIQNRENTRRAREVLKRLQADQLTLTQLFDFITARPDSEIIH